MNILDVVQSRKTCKAFDASKPLSKAQIEGIKTLLRYAPSSVNSQPWHFFLIESEAAKARIKPAMMEANQAKVMDAPLTVVFAVSNHLDDAALLHIADQEDQDQRYPTPENRAANEQGCKFFVDLNSKTREMQNHWCERQAYIALGTLLLGAEALGINATPIEGYFPEKMDEVLNLQEKNLHSIVVVTLGFSSSDDYNATLPKSRLPEDEIFTAL